jgi:hypothetical protein
VAVSLSALVAYLLVAFEAWAPASSHAFVESRAITDCRYIDIATTIATVALDPAEPPLFPGPNGRAETAVYLGAIASVESGQFSAKVQFCQTLGDGGTAAGLFQSHKSTRRACWSLESATRMALEQVRESFTACTKVGAPALAAYASGSCRKGWAAARMREDRALSWVSAHPFPTAGAR